MGTPEMRKQDSKNDWRDKVPNKVQKSVIKTEKELLSGKGIPHEAMMKKYEKWIFRSNSSERK
jgi:hypothetical protein